MLKNVFKSPQVRRTLALIQREVVGVAQDFWKDGHWEKPERRPAAEQDDFKGSSVTKHSFVRHAEPKRQSYEGYPLGVDSKGFWHAEPGEISERMWGRGFVTPADEYITDLLIRPLGITKDMNLLDLSAGLGGRMRKTTDEFGVYINGREPDPEIAARGMAMSVAAGRGKRAEITAYDPMNLVEPRKYDCVVARETIYRVEDKLTFIKSIVGCCKPQAQISFTDYIVNPEVADKPAIVAWKAFEVGANPASLIEMAEMWAKAGISLRVHDDQTDYYKKEIKKGLVAFAKFMASGAKPDAVTRRAVEKRITTWAHRMAAIEQGLKFFRFYGLR